MSELFPLPPRSVLILPASSAQSAHLSELSTMNAPFTVKTPWTTIAKRSVTLSFFFFTINTLRTYMFTLLTSPSAFLLDPMSTIAAIIIYPSIWCGLAIAVAIFVLGHFIGLGKLIDHLSDRFANGYSIINWPNKNIFDDKSTVAIQTAREMLGGKYLTTIPPMALPDDPDPFFEGSKTVRIFSIPLARAFLLMSSLVYERQDAQVNQASDLAAAARALPDGSDKSLDLLRQSQACLTASEKTIADKAAQWNLDYDAVSDLSTAGGPFASIFYTKIENNKDEPPFIVLTFKGTGPQNFAEFLVDCALNRTSASVFFNAGTVHKGFYTNLFMESRKSGQGSDGYGTIINTLKHVAARMKRNLPLGANYRIPLWVTGHSLGSALASLCYARLLQSIADLGDDIQLRDCYSFGNPRLGDGDFAAAFERSLLTPHDRPNILWRVQNHTDIVGNVPPGICDDESRRTLSSLSTLNYAHLGPCMVLLPNGQYQVVRAGSFHSRSSTKVVDSWYDGSYEGSQKTAGSLRLASRMVANTSDNREDDGRTPLTWLLETFLPKFVYDHFPSQYLENLLKIQTSSEN